MPVRNGENYLAEAIESLLNQSFEDFEIYISDNDSDDATESICRQYAQRDSRVRYRRQTENLGAVGNFNHVAEATDAPLFKWAAHDDVCHRDFLRRCVDALDEHPDAVWAHCRSDMIDENGESYLDQLPADDEEIVVEPDGSRRWRGWPRDDFDHPSPVRRWSGVLTGTRWCVDSYGVIRREALRQTRLETPVYGSEKVLIGELALLGKMAYVDEPLFAQRIHAEASSNLQSAAAQEAFTATSQQFNRTRFAKPFTSSRMRLLSEHRRAIHHIPLPMGQRIACYGVLARYVCQFGKYARVARAVWSGRGVGGGGRRMVDRQTGTDDREIAEVDPSTSGQPAAMQPEK